MLVLVLHKQQAIINEEFYSPLPYVYKYVFLTLRHITFFVGPINVINRGMPVHSLDIIFVYFPFWEEFQ